MMKKFTMHLRKAGNKLKNKYMAMMNHLLIKVKVLHPAKKKNQNQNLTQKLKEIRCVNISRNQVFTITT